MRPPSAVAMVDLAPSSGVEKKGVEPKGGAAQNAERTKSGDMDKNVEPDRASWSDDKARKDRTDRGIKKTAGPHQENSKGAKAPKVSAKTRKGRRVLQRLPQLRPVQLLSRERVRKSFQQTL